MCRHLGHIAAIEVNFTVARAIVSVAVAITVAALSIHVGSSLAISVNIIRIIDKIGIIYYGFTYKMSVEAAAMEFCVL